LIDEEQLAQWFRKTHWILAKDEPTQHQSRSIPPNPFCLRKALDAPVGSCQRRAGRCSTSET